MRKPKINIVTLGCSKNKVDSERLAAILNDNYDIVHDSDKKSDIVIINTCGFIGDAKEESIDTILEYAELRKTNKIKKLYVMGCLSQRLRTAQRRHSQHNGITTRHGKPTASHAYFVIHLPVN